MPKQFNLNNEEEMRFAAIDVGSNAVRLLLCHVHLTDGEEVYKKSELVRMPIRLGEDAFVNKFISGEKAHRLIQTMKAFKLLIDAFEAVDYRACATAAMREATNGKELVERIRKEANLDLEIIDGGVEAQIIYSNHVAEHLDQNSSYLYIDVGGGSTELTLFHKGKQIASRSFNVAVLFLIWAIFTVTIDNILKPMLLGRGLDVPMAVIFMGAIGGMLMSGIIGLFVGAILLALGYKVFLAWLDMQGTATDEHSPREKPAP